MPPLRRERAKDQHPKFRVDTHIFRELGELLVGRDSTALLELIKNSYDADATEIVVTALELETPARGTIVVQDNGSGMDDDQFTRGFLRIASRFKEEGSRRSKYFGRHFTGSKGIGRLAAHKLATLMDVVSVFGDPAKRSKLSIAARIDWERIESRETLDELDEEIRLSIVRLATPSPPGTTITLSRLRRPWNERERLRFVNECRAFQVPPILRDRLPKRVVQKPPLFSVPVVRDSSSTDGGCEIRLEGDFREGEDYWDPLIDLTNWVLEIDCLTDRSVVRYGIVPSQKTLEEIPWASRREFSHPHPDPEGGPHFQARVLARDEQVPKRVLEWTRTTGGIRVYLEGFRVLPYGDAGDDWLSLDSDVTRRSFNTDAVFNQLVQNESSAGDWQLSNLANRSYTGAVFLTQANAPTLRMLVNREGFVLEKAFDFVASTVRRGVDLLTRTRSAARHPQRKAAHEAREKRRREGSAAADGPARRDALLPVLAEVTAEAASAIREARSSLAAGKTKDVAEQLDRTNTVLERVTLAAERFSDSASMLRVLASLGTQMSGFVHEIRGLLGTAVALHEAVGRLRRQDEIGSQAKRALAPVERTLGDLRRQIERLATYLADVTSQDARRHRRRQPLAERLDAAAKLVGPPMDRRAITFSNEVPRGLKSSPMFPAELTIVFSNLLTNAVKSAGEAGRIRAKGKAMSDDGAIIVLENTGVAVDVAQSERWFLPFESSTTEVDAELGQGMGLGLTITRDVLEQYGATVRFVKPSPRFATAVELRFPG